VSYAPDILGGGGKTPDIWLIGMVLYGSVVFIVNNTLLHDSNSLNALLLVLSFLSTGSFFLVFWAINGM